MNQDQLDRFTRQIILEDGDLGCIPEHVFMFPQLGGTGIKLMWYLKDYGRK
jgi:hypothetical protein